MARYTIEFKPKAFKDLNALPRRDAERVYARIQGLHDNLFGDVKKLKNFTPSYRLRVGNWRVLFDVDGTRISIYRILNRRDAYE